MMNNNNVMKFKSGDRVRVDQRDSAYHIARKIQFQDATFVQYDSDKYGDIVAVVRIDGDALATIWDVCDIVKA